APVKAPSLPAFSPVAVPQFKFNLTKMTSVPQLRLQSKRFFTPNPAAYLQDPKAVEQRVFDVLGRFDKVEKEKLNSNAMFQKDLGLDSLDRVEVVLAIEEEFNTEFTDEQSDK